MEEVFAQLGDDNLKKLAMLLEFKNQSNHKEILKEVDKYLIPSFTKDKDTEEYVYQQLCDDTSLNQFLLLDSVIIDKLKPKVYKDVVEQAKKMFPRDIMLNLVRQVILERIKPKPNLKLIKIIKKLINLNKNQLVSEIFKLNKNELKLLPQDLPFNVELSKYITPKWNNTNKELILLSYDYVLENYLKMQSKFIQVYYNFYTLINWVCPKFQPYKRIIFIIPKGYKIQFCKNFIRFFIGKYEAKEKNGITHIFLVK